MSRKSLAYRAVTRKDIVVTPKSKKTGSAPRKPEEPSFEDNLKRLEEIVSKLDQGNLPLDESLNLYQDGINAYQTCHELLKVAEAKITKLVETLEGELKEEAFEVSEEDA